MASRIYLAASLCALALCACTEGEEPVVVETAPALSEASTDNRPNILLIVADDLGYTDLGSFGGEIETPNLDRLAAEGLQLTNFHTATTCSPTRAMIMSGVDNHQSGLGVMAEWSSGVGADTSELPGYFGHLNTSTASLADLMRDAGYHTYLSGKWHLGKTAETSPYARGFERTFALVNGGAGHIGISPMLPTDTAPTFRVNGEVIEPPEDFYSSRTFSEKMLEFIEADLGTDQPFFAYLAYTAPHWPLQAPEEAIAKYEGTYDEGYEVLHQQRIDALKALELVPQDLAIPPRNSYQRPWAELSDEEKQREIRTMEIYAAMIDEMDTYIGQVLARLEELGELDNTLVFFMSDNGAEGVTPQQAAYIPQPWIDANFDNSFDNMGAGDSYVMLGPDWAAASVASSRFFKGYTSQGGILSPALVWQPGMQTAGQRFTDLTSVLDLMPTFLDLAAHQHPGDTYQGRSIVPPQGNSLTAILTDATADVWGGNEATMGWELHGDKAYRQGDWKILSLAPPKGDGVWRLYNLAEDPSEMNDLSESEPEKFQQLLDGYQQYVETNGVVEDLNDIPRFERTAE